MLGFDVGAIVDTITLISIIGGFCVWLSRRLDTSQRRQIYLSAVQLAQACRDEVTIFWMRRGARRAHTLLRKLYGTRSADKAGVHRGYLSQRAFIASMHLATSYLTMGAVIFASGAILLAEKSSASNRLMGLALLIATGFAIYRMWDRRGDLLLAKKDRFGAVLGSALAITSVAMLLSVFSTRFAGKTDNGNIDYMLLILMFLFVLSLWYALTTLNRAFRRALPIGLLFFIVTSGTMFISIGELINGFGGGLTAWLYLISILLVCVRIFIYERLGSVRVRVALNIAAGSALLIPMVAYLHSSEHSFAEVLEIVTRVDERSQLRLIVLPFLIGAGVAIIGSLTYANALCDWISVGVTRRLLLSLAGAKRTSQYLKYLVFDIVIAALLVVGTYGLFSVLTHAYLLILPVPSEAFLDGIRSFATEAFSYREIAEEKKFDTYALGNQIAKFTAVFALTALIPTAFHLVLVAFVLIGRLVVIAFSYPAGEVMRVSAGVDASADDSLVDLAIDKVIKIGAYTTCAIGVALYLAANLICRPMPQGSVCVRTAPDGCECFLLPRSSAH